MLAGFEGRIRRDIRTASVGTRAALWRTMRTERDWARLGSEAEAADRAKGIPPHGSDLSDEALLEHLASHFVEEINEHCDTLEESEAAEQALLRGYREGA